MAALDLAFRLAAPLIRRLGRRKLAERRAQFALAGPVPGQVVFLGDSIVEQGQWDGWFPGLYTLNRGVGGERIADVMARLDSAICLPRAVVLMIGTNDAEAIGRGGDVAVVICAMEELVTAIRAAAPDAEIMINSIAPRTARFRDRLVAINTGYRQIAEAAGASYFDLWPAMAGPDGTIHSDLTTDGLHLTAEGYRVWVKCLQDQSAMRVSITEPRG